ncbi:acyl CoA:acetate/3-ketoacid CoA transferase [Neobacillus niacini]|uniref:acyl CoA:acetate/3-ketoacid CoA transferase n=1 Tax=Neobacillus niacini TaxID=86668 RepID=UPI0005EFC975|nr:CoA-transferase [Neobacillus niacini]
MGKFISAEEAALLIPDDATVGITGHWVGGFAEEIAIAVENRYLKTDHPQNITLVHATGIGDFKERGTNHFGHEGLIKRLICSHTSAAPSLASLIEQNKIECYFLPQGVICQMWKAIAANKPGVYSKVGLETFIDPRIEGGKITLKTNEEIVELVEIKGEEWLHYNRFPIDVAIIRGTYADEKGNICMDKEAILLEQRALAMAAKNSGGKVIAQVENIVKADTLHPKHVKVPGCLVDYIVIAKPENHLQTIPEAFNPALSGDIRMPLDQIKPMELTIRKIIARRCSMELANNKIVNLGIGMPEGIANVAAEEGVINDVIFTTEIGSFGGVLGSGFYFGTSFNAEATIEMADMFDFYDGGGLDIAFLGLAQVDRNGNVNVSKFGSKVAGPGGLINISQNTKKVIFCGTFTNGADIRIEDDKLVILKEGRDVKFCNHVDQITFSGKNAQKLNQKVLYVTERAVFELDGGELTLIEIAPGIDLERDIFSLMGFQPKLSNSLKQMDQGIFQPKWENSKKIKKSN